MKTVVRFIKKGVKWTENIMSKDVLFTPSCVIPIKNNKD